MSSKFLIRAREVAIENCADNGDLAEKAAINTEECRLFELEKEFFALWDRTDDYSIFQSDKNPLMSKLSLFFMARSMRSATQALQKKQARLVG